MISIIAAIATNGLIGKDNRLVWHLPADMRFFKQTTMGHALIMGRKTFESFGKPLPGRTSIVITRQKKFRHPGVIVTHSFYQALNMVNTNEEVFVIGGADIYRQALPLAHKLYLTIIHHTFDGDTFFPEINYCDWKLIKDEYREADDANAFAISFRQYERIER
ncbi:MAG: dihydrofolate reductase [Bacteroidales bacterium]|nr:dihydrofolate reductase [Bacteroidales bacterium]MDZ4205374.1 dihydrofolate reductase [Bacteroidales bacterium]